MPEKEYIVYSRAEHPSPLRERVTLRALFLGLFGPPLVWAGNHLIDGALMTHACYPGPWPLDVPIAGFGWVWWGTLGLFLASLALCAFFFWLSFRNWKLSGQENEGHIHHLMERGEGRTRYLSLIGMAWSVLFFAAVLFGAITYAIIPLCVHR